jgi:aminoglycoside phosphotransferase family enzyme/predicted kinase
MVIEDQREVIEFLSTPSTYDMPIDGVERIDTHSAVVFLAADRAYKLKRAVRYDYLDFSTCERRRAACEAEVRVNQRTAPQLYLGTVPVTREAGNTLALGGSGTPVDWLVRMIRFDQNAVFDQLAMRDALDLELMPALADAIGRLHAKATRREDHGGCAGMSWVVEGNAVAFAEFVESVFDNHLCMRVNELSRTALAQHKALLDERRQRGLVRECHGDLHLRNIVLLDGQPTLFDAVEFNDQISCVDVLYDLAFLLMDLWRLQLRAHANALSNAYLTKMDSLPALSLLPLFLSCRSAVRAKTSATAAKLQPDRTRRAELEATAREYLADAELFLHPPQATLTAIGGLPGSGKSVLARRLAANLGAAPGAVVLRSDVIRKSLFGLAPATRLGAEGYTKTVTTHVYRQLGERAALALRAGHAVILDAVFGDSHQRMAAEEIARSAQVPFTGLWLDAPARVLMDRIRARAHQERIDASDANVEVLQARLADDVGPVRWNRIHASGDLDVVQNCANEIVKASSGTGLPGGRYRR